jgi:(S)-mandelate dehydrogenase
MARNNLPPDCSERTKKQLNRASSISDLRSMAQGRIPKAIFDFYDGGSERERTLVSNVMSFESIRFVPRSLVDVSEPDASVMLFGSLSKLPVVVAPTGAIGFGWPSGDIAIAKAAEKSGIPYTLPTSSTVSIERLREAAPNARLWFQTYILKKRDYTDYLVDRALKADYEALIVTVDMPTGGKREKDIKNDFGLPFRISLRNSMDFSSRPSWLLRLLRHGMPSLENLRELAPSNASVGAVASSVGKNYDPSFDWDGLKRLRDMWPRKFIVKGIMHPDDAMKAASIGADGVVVSNHGGRQLDGAVSSLEALPHVVRAVGGKLDVMLDGGVRRGIDVIAAQAHGAVAVMIGRPTLYGVCAGGEAGAYRALQLLEDEYLRSMRLLGVTSAECINGLILSKGLK